MGWNQIYTKKFFCSSLAFLFLLPTCLSADPSENKETQYVLDMPSIASLHSLIEGVYYLIDANQPERAMPYFRRAIELDPNHADAYYFLGVSYYRQQEGVRHSQGSPLRVVGSPSGGREDLTQTQHTPVLGKPPKDLGVEHQSIAHALFYFHEAEKRGVVYDKFRPNLLKEIQRQYPDIQPSPWDWDSEEGQISRTSAPQVGRKPREAQIIVEAEARRKGSITLQSSDGTVQEFKLGEPISLPEGERYTLQFKRKQIHHLLKPLVLVSSVLGVWLLR